MKSNILLFLFCAILWSCNNSQQNHDGHNHDTHSHNGESCDGDHSQEGHDHSAESHSHSAEDHNHDDENCSGDDGHEGHDHGAEDGQKLDESTLNIITLNPEEFYEIIKTSGEITEAQGDKIVVPAKHNGLVSFSKKNIMEGVPVKKGEVLFTVSSSQIIDDNLEQKYFTTKASFEKAKVNFARANELYKDTIITEITFLEAKADFQTAEAEWNVLSKNYINGGTQQIVCPIDGFVNDVFVVDNQFVETGEPVISLIQNKELLIRADIPQSDYNKIPLIQSVSFLTPYDNIYHEISSINESNRSYGKTANKSFYTPLYLEIENQENLISGSFIEIFLKSSPIENAICLPLTAIMEEQGTHFVYVKHDGEFDKHYVELGGNDGKKVHILSGLSAGEKVVTLNPYRVKMAGMSSAVPHSHAH